MWRNARSVHQTSRATGFRAWLQELDGTVTDLPEDAFMISKETIQQLQADERKVHFILGARLRNVKEIYENVLSRAGRYREVRGPREKSTDPSPLKVKEVWVEKRPCPSPVELGHSPAAPYRTSSPLVEVVAWYHAGIAFP